MADARGALVGVESLDKLWFPRFGRALEPLPKTDVRREMRWLVDNRPRTGLVLGCSSSATPGVPWANLRTLMEGPAYYRRHGRA